MSVAVDVPWRGDFHVDERGHTCLVEGDIAYVQRILRRLITTPRQVNKATGEGVTPPDYLFEPEFGAGIRRLINRPAQAKVIERLITGQITVDPETSTTVRPEVNVFLSPDGTLQANIVALRNPGFTVAFGVRLEG